MDLLGLAGLPTLGNFIPRWIGAALTYARRYALFTLVGFAGEDDLDAPDLTSDQPRGLQTNGVASEIVSPTNLPAGQILKPATGRVIAPSGAKPATQAKLTTEQSAAIRIELIQEIEALLHNEDFQLRAITILKAKNHLSASDAKVIEDAFATRMAQQVPVPKCQQNFKPRRPSSR